jgi:hypothetical protein
MNFDFLATFGTLVFIAVVLAILMQVPIIIWVLTIFFIIISRIFTK